MSEVSADNEAYVRLPLLPNGEIGAGFSIGDLDLPLFKLPLEPHAAREPELHQIWSEMLSDGVEFVAPVLRRRLPPQPDVTVAAPPLAPLAVRDVQAPRVHARQQVSENWSGGFIMPTRGDSFTRVAASWEVREVTRGNPADETNREQPGFAGHGERLDHRCSIWIGLDGWQGWANSMPQLGTEHSETGSHRFWLQWWRPESERFQHYVDGIDLQPGDRVTCNLSVLPDDNGAGVQGTRGSVGSVAQFHFMRVRNSGGILDKKFTTVEIHGERPARGSSAQWVLERPAAAYIDGGGAARVSGLHPIPDFSLVELLSFAARGVNSANAGHVRNYTARRMDLTSIFVKRSNPRRTAVVSKAKRRRGSDLIEVVYQ